MAAADTAKLVAQLTLDDRYTKGVGKAIGATDKLSTRLGRIGTSAQKGVGTAISNLGKLGLVAGGLVATQVYAGVKSLEALERAQQSVRAVITSTGGAAGVTESQVFDLASSLEKVTTADDKLIASGEALLLTFTNIGADVFPDTTKAMVDMAIAMADGDVEAANFHDTALQLGKALNDPVAGVNALKKAGVSFTKEQKDQIKVLVESGKTLEAQKLILAEVEKEFGQAGKAAGTGFGADMRRFGDAVEDAQQALAVGLLPVITKVADLLGKKLGEPATMDAITAFGNDLADAFDDILVAAAKIPWTAISDAMKLAGTGAKAALDFFVGLPSWVQTAVLTGWGLNKLTGGVLQDVVASLASGLIKGVLGINAGVVNINAATVTGAGGIPGAAGGGGKGILGKLGTIAGVVIAPAAGLQIGSEIAKELGANVSDNPLTNLKMLLQTYLPGLPILNDNSVKQNQKLNDLVRGDAETQSRQNIANERLEAIRGFTDEQSQAASDLLRSQERTEATAEASKVQGQANAFAIRDAVNTKGGLMQTGINAAKTAMDAVKTQVSASGQQQAFAIRDKDLSVAVTNVNNVSTYVSVRDQIATSQKIKSVYRVAS